MIFGLWLLAFANLAQLLFWSYQVHTLLNKLMCKNWAEYELVKNGPALAVPAVDDEEAKLEEQEVLNELNGVFRGA